MTRIDAARRTLLRCAALLPVAMGARAHGAEYAGPAEVFGEIDRREAQAAARLARIAEQIPGARAFALSVAADHERHRAERGRLRRRLGLPAAGAPPPAEEGDGTLDALRAAQEALVHAHAEGLPALGDPAAVAALGRHMVALSRQLAVIDLWIEGEE